MEAPFFGVSIEQAILFGIGFWLLAAAFVVPHSKRQARKLVAIIGLGFLAAPILFNVCVRILSR